ncbi:hypothetical protein DH2020_036474 [Rehmannia glutinosa]|uniref:Sulfotransferase n=1 Tax=Rehmannia glutinosa TaxID=99300 RepID=A0ABR0V3L5_REHGL
MEKKEDPNFSSAPKLELEELLQTLDQKINWDGRKLVKYNGFWFPMPFFPPIISTQKHFKAKDSDILLASVPKSGTTWLKALMFCIANRNIYTIDQNPLLTSNPHLLVPFLELGLYFHQENPDLQHLSDPRFFSSHIPFNILPNSIRDSECKIIFICRSPLDQFISSYHFLLDNKFEKDAVPLELDEAFDMFCEGIHSWGPFWDHILGYWNAHLKNPEKVLFLKYEDLKEDIAFHIKKIAEFMGYPFSEEELKQGVVDQIKKMCSLENLKNLEVNKCGYVQGIMKNSSFFRKGEVGDWTNYLTPAMAERVKKVMESKFGGYGLRFKI